MGRPFELFNREGVNGGTETEVVKFPFIPLVIASLCTPFPVSASAVGIEMPFG